MSKLRKVLACGTKVMPVVAFFTGAATFTDYITLLHITKEMGYWIVAIIAILCVAVFIAEHIIETKSFDKASVDFHAFHDQLVDAFFDMRNKNLFAAAHHSRTAFYSELEHHSELLCDSIANFIENRYNKKFSVCIKMFDGESLKTAEKSGDVGDLKVFSLCRGGYDNLGRKARENERKKKIEDRVCEPIRDISDFYTMMLANETTDGSKTEAAAAFACRDLRKHQLRLARFNAFSKKHCSQNHRLLTFRPYNITSPKYWEKYQCTVCVPIRIYKHYLPKAEQHLITGEYQVVGFLCIDNPRPISKRLMQELKTYTIGFAHAFSGFFHEVAIMDQKIGSTIS